MNSIHYHVGSPVKAFSRHWLAFTAGIVLSLLAAGTGLHYSNSHAPPGTLKKLILEGESGSRGYNSYNRGSMRCAKSNRAPLNLTGMTIREIQYYQSLPSCSTQKLLAVGHYQIIPETLNHAVRELNLHPSTPFSPAVQDTIFALYLAKEKQPAIDRWVRHGQDLYSAKYAVAREWAAFKAPSGRGLYDGKGNNKARISSTRVEGALRKARDDFQKLVDAGLDEDTAYATALGIPVVKKNG
ncbi:MAG: hypothetical protein JG718_12620 [Candidatus Thiothrix moscowensis]|nr:hypothetical protein [Candidatus Thiothrix moscowensis]